MEIADTFTTQKDKRHHGWWDHERHHVITGRPRKGDGDEKFSKKREVKRKQIDDEELSERPLRTIKNIAIMVTIVSIQKLLLDSFLWKGYGAIHLSLLKNKAGYTAADASGSAFSLIPARVCICA